MNNNNKLIDDINSRNFININTQLNIKRNSKPYFSTEQTNKNVITDFDSFPYKRWFRGEYQSDIPIVIEREAGWRPRNDMCYVPQIEKQEKELPPNHFFQPPCSTVYPKIIKDTDIGLYDIKLNDNCINMYR